MIAPYTVVGDAFHADKPQIWSPTSILPLAFNYPYDVHDGKRLAAATAHDANPAAQDKVVLVSNFFDFLRKIAPAEK